MIVLRLGWFSKRTKVYIRPPESANRWPSVAPSSPKRIAPAQPPVLYSLPNPSSLASVL